MNCHTLLGVITVLSWLTTVAQAATVPVAVTKKLPFDGEVFQVEGHTGFIIRPPGAKPGKALPWVWYAPTLPGLPADEEKWMFERFLAAGIAIAGLDVGESYGSPAGRALYTRFHREVTRKRSLAKRAILLARSRGGLMLYSWACENAKSVAGIAGIYPVCNPASYPGTANACKAYGLTEAEFKAQQKKHNPLEHLAPLARARVPIFHIHGDVDTVVPLEANSGELARRYRALGGEMQLVVPPGQGHNMWTGFFQCQELVDFVLGCARDAR